MIHRNRYALSDRIDRYVCEKIVKKVSKSIVGLERVWYH